MGPLCPLVSAYLVYLLGFRGYHYIGNGFLDCSLLQHHKILRIACLDMENSCMTNVILNLHIFGMSAV